MNLFIQIGRHLPRPGERIVLQCFARHFERFCRRSPSTEFHPQRTDQLSFTRVGHHRELGSTGRAPEEHTERPFPRLLDFLEVHIGFAVETDEFHSCSSRLNPITAYPPGLSYSPAGYGYAQQFPDIAEWSGRSRRARGLPYRMCEPTSGQTGCAQGAEGPMPRTWLRYCPQTTHSAPRRMDTDIHSCFPRCPKP